MGDDRDLNRFISCVSSRYDHDTIISGTSMAALLLVPVACAFILIVIPLNYETTNYDSRMNGIYTSMIIESIMITFIMMSMYNRLSDHSKRDHEWRSGLIGYASGLGCDVGRLSRMDAEATHLERGRAKYPALAVMAVSLLIIPAALTNLENSYTNVMEIRGQYIYASIALAFVMFFLVFITILRYPYQHEHRQVRFTEELARVLDGAGIYIEPMPEVIRHRPVWIHVLLFVVTVGLYSFVMLFIVYRATNNHFYNQWNYEERLMVTLVRAEGGTGIAPVESPRTGFDLRAILGSV